MSKQILVNSIITPDGTRLISYHRHDYKCHLDKNGTEYCIDGGTDYLKRSYTISPIEASLYEGDPIEELREYIHRLRTTKKGAEPIKPFRLVKLKDISDSWLENVIKYEKEYRPDNIYLNTYIREQEYRKLNNITVDEE